MRTLTTVLLLLLVGTVGSFAQMLDNFDAANPDSGMYWTASEGAPSYVTLKQDTANKHEGAASLLVRASIGAFHGWGSFVQFGVNTELQDWSKSDTLSLWIKINMAPSLPENLVFRISIADSMPGGNVEEWLYQNNTILDQATTEWVNLKVPLTARTSDGTTTPNETGFVYPPSNWNFSRNDMKLDLTKIMKISFALVTDGWNPSGNLPADSLEVQFDAFERTGNRPIPLLIFTGMDFASSVSNVWAWGQSSASVVTGAGTTSNANAVRWIQGNEWGNGWTGWGVDLTPAGDLSGAWQVDSLKFKMKCDTGVGELRVQVETNNPKEKRGALFTPPNDTLWHSYSFKLSEMYGPDGTPTFDSSKVTQFGIMAQASAKAGKVIYITDIWTGNPDIDVIPPLPPTNVAVASPTNYRNLVTWTDPPNEPGSKYSVYFAEQAWTDYKAADVENVPALSALTIPAGTEFIEHYLRAPNSDRDLTYYYGVTATDAAGNVSVAAVQSTPKTTKAKGVPTIAVAPPAGLTIDGDLTEWTSSSIRPFFLSKDSAFISTNGSLDGDNDLSVYAWLAVDANYLYVAFDVIDDIVAVDTTKADTYRNDSPDLFLGLYDWRGKTHSGLAGGSTPDFHFRFCENKVYYDNSGKNMLYAETAPGVLHPNYRWTRKILTSGYTVEAKLSWAELAAINSSTLFSPVEGMRIPIDFAINDRDALENDRDCILMYSFNNQDYSWQDMWRWTYTWIGNKMTATDVEQVDEMPRAFALNQNYPNPFNPTTVISYQLSTSSPVEMRVFDMLGREVSVLVNAMQGPGTYNVTFDASGLATGMYMYQLKAGSEVSVRKMLLLK